LKGKNELHPSVKTPVNYLSTWYVIADGICAHISFDHRVDFN